MRRFKFVSKCADTECMNIKGLVNPNFISNGIKPSEGVQKNERVIKSDNTSERDANGQEFYSKNKKKQRMTKEQFDRAMALLNQKTFMVEMKWRAYEVLENDFFYAEVKSEDGTVIRRMSEFDMWELFEDKSVDETKGQLLKKSA
jgi:hypothetical protein